MCCPSPPCCVKPPGLVFLSLALSAYVAIVLKKDDGNFTGWLKW